jgi:hypothetical protein
MPPRGVKSKKRIRPYKKIIQSLKKSGKSDKTAQRIASATVNKTRKKKGETKESK